MKKLLFLLAFLPFLVNGQVTEKFSSTSSNYDLDEWHDQGTIWERTDDNFTVLYNTPVVGVYFSDSAVTIALTEDEWATVTNAAYNLWTGQASGMSVTVASGDSITVSEPGDYLANISLSFSAEVTDTIEMAIVKNGTATAPRVSLTQLDTGLVSFSLSAMLFGMTTGDDVTLKVRNISDGDDVIVRHGSAYMYMLKPD